MKVKIDGTTLKGEYGLLSDYDGTLVYGGEEAHTILAKKYFEFLQIDPKLSEAGTSFSDLLKGRFADQELIESIIDLFYLTRNLIFQRPSDKVLKEHLDKMCPPFGQIAYKKLFHEFKHASEQVIRLLRGELKVCLYDDARRLLSQPHLPKKSCIVTGCPVDIMRSNAIFDGIDFSSSFKGVICADDKNGPQKPNPAPYLKGANLIDMEPSRCIAIEDSYSGLLSAVRAGCIALLLNRGKKPLSAKTKSLIADSNVLVIDSLDQIGFSN